MTVRKLRLQLRLWWRLAPGVALLFGLASSISHGGTEPPQAQANKLMPPAAAPLGKLMDLVNSNTLTIVSSSPNGTYMPIAHDLSTVLDHGDDLRILVVLGKGGVQNVRDVRLLRGVDLGIATTNTLSYFRRTNEIGNIDDRIVYICKLYNEEIHFVARPEISALEDLRGKRVNFNYVASGTQLAARDIFSRRGINVQEVNLGTEDALDRMRNGEIVATILSAGKPAPGITSISSTDGFHFLPVAFGRDLQDDYLPVMLTSQDYPNLIRAGEDIETVAAGALLIAYNWPKNSDRYRRIEKFVDAFFANIDELKKPPRHPKWRETNLAATVPGWTRFEAAEQWLINNNQATYLSDQRKFEQFMLERANRADRNQTNSDHEALFEEFLKWSRTRERR